MLVAQAADSGLDVSVVAWPCFPSCQQLGKQTTHGTSPV